MMVEFYIYSYTVIATLVTWSMYATLYGKPSPFRSWAEASFIGFSFGLNIVVTFSYIVRTAWEPMFRGTWFPAVGILLGLLMIARLFPNYNYISRVPIAISIGTNLALSLRTQIFTGFITLTKPLLTLQYLHRLFSCLHFSFIVYVLLVH